MKTRHRWRRTGLAAAFFVLHVSGVHAQDATTGAYSGRPIYSEPGSALQLPPGCAVEPAWRAKLGTSDLEVWVADCNGAAHAWLVRRSVIEMLPGRQARLRFLILDDRAWSGETAGDTVSVQCSGRSGGDPGYVVVGAKWRAAGSELRLSAATAAVRADRAAQKLVDVPVARIDCIRFPAREAMMRRLQQESR